MREERFAYQLIAPAAGILLLLIAYPFVMSLYMSLTDKTIGAPGVFVGLRNFVWLLDDGIFLRTVTNSFVYTFSAVMLKTLLGLLLAVALGAAVRGREFLRAAALLPWVIPISLSTLAWWWMFDPMFSVINWHLRSFGLVTAGVNWLGDPFWARVAVITVNVWRGIPFFALAFLAGLVSIPRELYESAETDGAGPLRAFWHITLPLLRPILAIVVLYSTVMTIADFEIVFILTRGGPLSSTHLFSTYAYQVGLAGTRISEGAAISLFIFPFLAIAAYLIFRIVRRGEEYA
jgi:multiple sugar transport system permease protein